MSSALAARVCPKRAVCSPSNRHVAVPRLVAARQGPQQAMLRQTLARVKINTDYSEDTAAYDAENVTLEEVEMADPTGVVGDIM